MEQISQLYEWQSWQDVDSSDHENTHSEDNHNNEGKNERKGFSGLEQAPDTAPMFMNMSKREQCAVLETMLFTAEEPLSAQTLYDLLIVPCVSPAAEKKGKPTPVTPTTQRGMYDGKPQNSQAEHLHQNGSAVHVAYLTIDAPEEYILPEQQPNGSEQEYPQWFADETAGMAYLQDLIEELNREFISTGRVFEIVSSTINGITGYIFATRQEHGEMLARLVKSKTKKRMSQAALETLAIVAYRQPISKPELEIVRGVNSGEIINKLLEKNLVTIVGRSEAVGKPLLYGTTEDFLRLFGLQTLEDLPKLRELDELLEHKADILEAIQSAQEAQQTARGGTKNPLKQMKAGREIDSL